MRPAKRRVEGLGLGGDLVEGLQEGAEVLLLRLLQLLRSLTRRGVGAGGGREAAVMSAMLPAALSALQKGETPVGTNPAWCVVRLTIGVPIDRARTCLARTEDRTSLTRVVARVPPWRGRCDLPLVVAPGRRVGCRERQIGGKKRRVEAAPWFAGKPDWSSCDTFSRPSRLFALRWHPRRFLGTAPLFRAPAWVPAPGAQAPQRYSPDDPEGVVGGFTTPVTPAGAPSDAGGRARGSPKSVTFPRASARGSSAPPTKIDRTPIDLPCHCDGCGKYILAARHNCDACEDYDLCAPCYASLVDGTLAHEHDASCFQVMDWTEEGGGGAREASRSTAAHATPVSDGTGGARSDDRGDPGWRHRRRKGRGRGGAFPTPTAGRLGTAGHSWRWRERRGHERARPGE